MLRQKVGGVLQKAGLAQASHSGKALLNVLDTYPRDELFQIEEEQLEDFASAILQLDERPRFRVLPRVDKFNRFVSCLVYVPRDKFNSDLRERIGLHLAEAFNGRVSAFYPAFPEGTLARVHFIFGRDAKDMPTIDAKALEASVIALAETWDDRFEMALETQGRVENPGFTPGYKNTNAPEAAVSDAKVIASLNDETPLAVRFYQRAGGKKGSEVGIKLFHKGAALPLSRRVPLLENFGFEVVDESTYEAADGAVHLHDMTLDLVGGASFDVAKHGDRLQNAFEAVWSGVAESDGYNALVVKAGLDWRMASMFRAYSLYLRQIRSGFSQDYLWQTLQNNSALVGHLVALFQTRFDPAHEGDRAKASDKPLKAIDKALQAVESINEDTILRRFTNAITSTLRTNFYQLEEDGSPRRVLAFKLDPQQVTQLPEPRPYREIWVYSPVLEGVHLRYGSVALGGLRWSDRAQDFRTEVLGLVKAQQVKNAVIVPEGAKGCFSP